MWHYALNSDEMNQYWMLSTDEMSLWQSQTFGTTNDVVNVYTLNAFVDYAFLMASTEANTSASLAANGYSQNGTYYAQTENMVPAAPPFFIGPGFDVGRGSSGVSFNGSGGVKTGVAFGGLGNGNQDPGYGGVPAQLGFVTWDNKPNSTSIQPPAGPGFGSKRLTWLSIDYGCAFGLPPEIDLNVTKAAGTVRVPMLTNPPAGGPIQSVTTLAFNFFQHTTGVAASGWPDPDGTGGIPSGFAGVAPSGGGSGQLATLSNSGSIPCSPTTVGFSLNITYGTTGLVPGLTFDPSKADVSGSKQVFLFP
jgi:hypothetical protein